MLSGIEATATTLLWIAVAVPLALLWVAVVVDLLRRNDLNVVRKAVWVAIVFFAAHIGVLVYFIFRPVPKPAGKRDRDKADRSSRIVTNIERLHQEHEAGEIDDDDYLEAKRELLGLAPR